MPLSTLLPHLPAPLREELTARLSSPDLQSATPAEVRMRKGRIASVTLFCEGRLINLPLAFVADGEALKTTFASAVGGSLYAYEDAIKEGYATMHGGIRIGVAGRVFCKDNGIRAVTAIHSLVFRLPSGCASADALLSHLREHAGGILLFSPPGGGKTTLLRALAKRAAREYRVAVIDAREELFVEGEELFIDRLVSYPKAKGAEIAVRTLSPELLILDELGADDAQALASLASLGVRVVASAHGREAGEILTSRALAPLFHSGMFSYLWDVCRGIPLPVSEVGAS